MPDKKNAVWSKRISNRLHNDLRNIPSEPYEKMENEIEDIMMRYAFTYNNDYRRPYIGRDEE